MDVGLAGDGHRLVGDEAVDEAGEDAEVLLECRPALEGDGVEIGVVGPHGQGELEGRHLGEVGVLDVARLEVVADPLHLLGDGGVIGVDHLLGDAEDVAEGGWDDLDAPAL